MTRLLPWILGNVLWMAVLALAQDGAPRTESQTGSQQGPRAITLEGVENAFRLSPNLYSGGDPHGDPSFAAIERLGVKTIISVDGSIPNAEAARKRGMRYVHLPIGYDKVPREQATRIVQAMKTLPGPIYVHCHHGKHRGPAAAAILGISAEGWTKDQAVAWMQRAGTSPDYSGLYASVRAFEVPTKQELARVGTDLPERAKIPAFVTSMVAVDATWDRLKAIQKNGFKPPKDQPDLDPPHEALQLVEHFRELSRSAEAQRNGDAFVVLLKATERDAAALEQALRKAKPQSEINAAFTVVSKRCTTCHKSFRDH